MTSALNRQTAASALSRAITIGARLASRPTGLAGRLAGQRSTTQQGLGQGELKVGRVSRGPDQERAVLVRPVDVVHDAEGRTGLGLLREADLEASAESFTETMGNLVPVRLSEPPCTPLLNG